MTTCHQCGSEVAETDSFCPYCGISLAPVAVPGSEEDEFASTIIMPTAKAESSPADVMPAEPESTDVAAIDAPPESSEEEPETILSAVPESKPSEQAIDFGNLPTPPALEKLERSVSSPAQSESVQSREPLQIDAEPIAAPNELPVVSEPSPIEEPEEAQEEAPLFEQAPQESTTVNEAVASDENEAISRPEEILETQEEGGPAPSQFDSVRIIDDRFTPTGVRQNPPSPSADDIAGKKVSTGLPRSRTSSSIGLVDTDGRRAAKLKPLDEGTFLYNRYEIVRKIGGGGMGAVYLASDNNLGGVLRAVKEMVQAHIEEEQQVKAIDDFKRESMILSQLDHPSIPTIYDYFFDDEEGRFYLVMKYISGGDLAARLRAAPEGRIDEKTVTEWSIQIADVLD
jgi:hypothetical protein